LAHEWPLPPQLGQLLRPEAPHCPHGVEPPPPVEELLWGAGARWPVELKAFAILGATAATGLYPSAFAINKNQPTIVHAMKMFAKIIMPSDNTIDLPCFRLYQATIEGSMYKQSPRRLLNMGCESPFRS
jgi:hypothetical protein